MALSFAPPSRRCISISLFQMKQGEEPPAFAASIVLSAYRAMHPALIACGEAGTRPSSRRQFLAQRLRQISGVRPIASEDHSTTHSSALSEMEAAELNRIDLLEEVETG